MAIVQIPGGMIVGGLIDFPGPAPAFVAGNLNSAATRVGQIMRMPKTGTLHSVEFLVGAIANNPDNGMRVSFQDIESTGIYDGVVDQYRIITSLTANTWHVLPGPMTSDGTDGGVKRSVTAGDYVAVMFDLQTFVSGDSLSLQRLQPMSFSVAYPFENLNYAVQAGFKSTNNAYMCMALKYTDGYVWLNNFVLPISALNNNSFASNSTPDERALRFQMPWSCEIDGIWVRGIFGQAVDIVLYNAASSVIYTASLADADWSFTTQGGWYFFPIPPQAITAATTYRVSVKPTTTSTITAYDFDVPNTTLMNIVPGGSEWYSSTRTDAGAWTDVTTKRPWITLRVSGIDVTAGGGGGGGAFTFMG